MDKRIKNHTATTYHTDHFTPEQVRHLNDSANRQEKIIGRVYWHGYPKGLTPSQAHQIILTRGSQFGKKSHQMWPLTSTRRAITNLTDADILRKTNRTATGEFGRPETLWIWKAPNADTPKQASIFDDKPKSKAYEL